MKYPLEVNILLCMDKALGEYSYQYITHTHSFEKKDGNLKLELGKFTTT